MESIAPLLKPLSVYELEQEHKPQPENRSGIACPDPECGAEMRWGALAPRAHPPMRTIHCDACDFSKVVQYNG